MEEKRDKKREKNERESEGEEREVAGLIGGAHSLLLSHFFMLELTDVTDLT